MEHYPIWVVLTYNASSRLLVGLRNFPWHVNVLSGDVFEFRAVLSDVLAFFIILIVEALGAVDSEVLVEKARG